VAVADEIDVNDQTIWQIINGIKLPSGNPRGVGPRLQSKLDAGYPGWANLPSGPSTTVGRSRTSESVKSFNAWPYSRVDLSKLSRLNGVAARAMENAMLATAGDLGVDIRTSKQAIARKTG